MDMGLRNGYLLEISCILELGNGLLGLVDNHYQTLFEMFHEMNNPDEIEPQRIILCLSMSCFVLIKHKEFLWAMENILSTPIRCGFYEWSYPEKDLVLLPSDSDLNLSINSNSTSSTSSLFSTPSSPSIFTPIPRVLSVAKWLSDSLYTVLANYEVPSKNAGDSEILENTRKLSTRMHVWKCDIGIHDSETFVSNGGIISSLPLKKTIDLSVNGKLKGFCSYCGYRGSFSCSKTSAFGEINRGEYVVSMEVDTKRKTLIYSLDGVTLSIGFINIPLPAAFVFSAHGQKAELLSVQKKVETAVPHYLYNKNVGFIDYEDEKRTEDYMKYTTPLDIALNQSEDKLYFEESNYHFIPLPTYSMDVNGQDDEEQPPVLDVIGRGCIWKGKCASIILEPPIKALSCSVRSNKETTAIFGGKCCDNPSLHDKTMWRFEFKSIPAENSYHMAEVGVLDIESERNIQHLQMFNHISPESYGNVGCESFFFNSEGEIGNGIFVVEDTKSMWGYQDNPCLVILELNMCAEEKERTLFFAANGKKARVYCKGLPACVNVYYDAFDKGYSMEFVSVKRMGEESMEMHHDRGDKCLGWPLYFK